MREVLWSVAILNFSSLENKLETSVLNPQPSGWVSSLSGAKIVLHSFPGLKAIVTLRGVTPHHQLGCERLSLSRAIKLNDFSCLQNPSDFLNSSFRTIFGEFDPGSG